MFETRSTYVLLINVKTWSRNTLSIDNTTINYVAFKLSCIKYCTLTQYYVFVNYSVVIYDATKFIDFVIK